MARIYPWPVPMVEAKVPWTCPTCRSVSSSTAIRFASRTGFDFFGFSASGRFIAIEAKESDAAYLPLGVESGHGVKVHQLRALREVDRAGGIAVVIWQHQGHIVPLGVSLLTGGSIAWKNVSMHSRGYDGEEGISGMLHPHLYDPDYIPWLTAPGAATP